MILIVVRPQPGCDSTIAAARERGLDARGYPLFEVRPRMWDTPVPGSFDAVLVGSANALRHGGAGLAALSGKPAYAVGEATASACREAGLEVVVTGEGGLQQVLARLDPAHRRLLRLAGAARVDLDPPPGVAIAERIVYASEPLPMPAELAAILRAPAVIMLHSAEAARHFRSRCEAQSLDLSQLSLAAIGPRVAEAAGHGWHAVQCAAQPGEAALLALAAEMCKESVALGSDPPKARETMAEPLQQETTAPPVFAPPPRKRAGWPLVLALLAFALGVAGTVWVASRGYLEDLGLVERSGAPVAVRSSVSPGVAAARSSPAGTAELEQVGDVEARLAMLEDRLSRIDVQADSASGNAARAEGLLVAFAARRMIDRGEPLRYLADQLRLRFANAQPRAVSTIIMFARDPVTADQLAARLEALSPDLTGTAPDTTFVDRALNDLANLFTVRREPSEVIGPEAAVERARVMLRSGRIDEAVAQVQRLPGADAADKWIADARRYAEVQSALDLIETTAMLEPDRLQDSSGIRVDQPSPLARPPAPATARPD
jgi:uroporphyrinogen-III synthase